jgi:F-type H+-transporting ATPase subunit delta
MADIIQARRYAQAMFQLALEQNQAENWQADIEALAQAVQDKSVLDVLENPAVSRQQKDDMLGRAGSGVSPVVMNLIKLLVSRGAIRILKDIAQEYGKLLDESQGIVSGNIMTAVPLDDEEKKKLSENIGGLIKKTVELESAVDPDILGGMVVRVGGKLLDGSTRSKLAALKRQLASGEKRR